MTTRRVLLALSAIAILAIASLASLVAGFFAGATYTSTREAQTDSHTSQRSCPPPRRETRRRHPDTGRKPPRRLCFSLGWFSVRRLSPEYLGLRSPEPRWAVIRCFLFGKSSRPRAQCVRRANRRVLSPTR